MPFIFEKLELPEVILIKPKVFGDGRGFFSETYKYSEFAAGGIPDVFVQDNHSKSAKNVLRGLHYQLNPKPQGKLVRCLSGSILDVAVDIRKKSKTYLKWVAAALDSNNMHMLYIPRGFAHGFLTSSDNTEVFYKTTAEYSPEHERGICWNDTSIGIAWGITSPVLSARDSALPRSPDADNNF